MNLLNRTPFAAKYTTTHDKAGSECLVIVVKATYRLPLAGEAPELMEQQAPIVLSDTATGEPGLSSPEYESDFCLTKPKVDVLLLGTAYAPKGIRLSHPTHKAKITRCRWFNQSATRFSRRVVAQRFRQKCTGPRANMSRQCGYVYMGVTTG
jgi:hypothetical protein